MTYTSIEEAWGGVSGSSMLDTDLPERPDTSKLHPAHRKQLQRRSQNQEDNEYQCTYYGAPCDEAVERNQRYNQQAKNLVQGYPQYYPGHYPLMPQYPWYPQPRHDFMDYSNHISNMWYNHPWRYYPEVAQDIYEYQEAHPRQRPQRGPPLRRPPHRGRMNHRVERFTDSERPLGGLHKITIIFLIFLFAMALALCVVLLCLARSIRT